MTQPLRSIEAPRHAPSGSLRWSLAPVREARCLLEEGRHAEVVERLRPRPYEELRTAPELAVLFATALMQVGHLEQADQVSAQALSTARAVGDHRQEALATALSGEVALALGDLPRASRWFSQARTLAAEQRDTPLAGECSARLGQIALACDDPGSAVTALLGAVAAYEALGAAPEVLRCQLDLANAYRRTGRLDDALAIADRAVAAARVLGAAALHADALATRAEVQLVAGDPGVALREAVQAAAMQRSVGELAKEAEALSLARQAQTALGAPRRRVLASTETRREGRHAGAACGSRIELAEKCHVR